MLLHSREPSTTSVRAGTRAPWREKSDLFAGEASLGGDEIGLVRAVGSGRRPQSRREASYATHVSSRSAASYRGPFVDPIYKEKWEEFQPFDLYKDQSLAAAGNQDGVDEHTAAARPTPPVTPIRTSTLLPLSQQTGRALSPLAERLSQSVLGVQGVSIGSSNDHSAERMGVGSPWMSRPQATSMTLFSYLPSLSSPTSQPTSSLFNPAHPPSPNDYFGAAGPLVRRSDSWWNRFSRTSFLDRRSNYGGASLRARYDIHDPTPAPRLGAIEEGSIRSVDKSRPGSEAGQCQLERVDGPAAQSKSGFLQGVYQHESEGVPGHEARPVGDVRPDGRYGPNREDGGRHERGAAPARIGEYKLGGRAECGDTRVRGGVGGGPCRHGPTAQPDTVRRIDNSVRLVASPEAVEDPTATPFRMESAKQGPRSPMKVSERVKEFERAQMESLKQRERPNKAGHGMAPIASLFIANPDNRRSDDSWPAL